MNLLIGALVAAPVVAVLYAYIGYPLVLWIIGSIRPPRRVVQSAGMQLPYVTITMPIYNSVASVRHTLERLLEVDFPKDRLQLLVISDASTDGTDDVVREFATRGVELIRLPERLGKTYAENLAVSVARGEIIVNVDATVLVPAGSLRPLVEAFDDPTVGVASGRDVSVGAADGVATNPDSSYVRYEMWIRDLETAVGSIVGASGCFYGFRRCIHERALPPQFSWDFASALIARKQGYRAISVPAAVCIVPRTPEVRTELRRKVRTMARGLGTLFYLRDLMNPIRYGGFALMLISHKLFRWLPYLLSPVAIIALAVLAAHSTTARILTALLVIGIVVGTVGARTRDASPSKPIALAGFVLASLVAGFLAWWELFRRAQMATWDPTPRARGIVS
jgi:cellulose synthase/poly-beta-1,6-N-acetylglucosamine synthase-like glycosyltransferase